MIQPCCGSFVEIYQDTRVFSSLDWVLRKCHLIDYIWNECSAHVIQVDRKQELILIWCYDHMREAVGGLSVGTCSVDRGRGAHVRIWGVTGPRKWLHLFNSCCIFFFTRSPVICVKICHLLWGQVEVEVGHFLSNVALCAWQHLAGHLKWQMSKTVKVNCCHHKTCHQIITLWPPAMAITSRGGFASF